MTTDSEAGFDWASWAAADLATWLQGLATIGTLFVAVWVLKRELDDRRTRVEQERRSQARRVAVSDPRLSGRIRRSPRGGLQADYEVTTANHSDLTVSRCRLRWLAQSKVPKGDHARWESVSEQDLGRMLSGAEDSHRHRIRAIPADGAIPLQVEVELLFTDSAGLRWMRDAGHTLHEVIGDDPW